MSDAAASSLELVIEEVIASAASFRHLGRSTSGSRGLSLPQQAILELIQQHSDLTVPQLARRRGTSRQNVQVLVDRLAGAGFIRYVANPDHRRSERVQLTAPGRRVLSSSRRSHASWLSGLQTEVTEDQVRVCLELLQSIRARLSDKHPGPSQVPVRARRSRRRKHASEPVVPMEPSFEPVEEPTVDTAPPEELPVNLL